MTHETTANEIRIAGANCPWCFNESLERLRAYPGVIDARASMGGECLRIDHHGIPVDELLVLVRRHLHGADLSSAESVMVQVDAQEAAIHCPHTDPAIRGKPAQQPG